MMEHYPDEDTPVGYTKYDIPDIVTLTAQQCCGSYGAIVEILFRANQIKRV